MNNFDHTNVLNCWPSVSTKVNKIKKGISKVNSITIQEQEIPEQDKVHINETKIM